MSRQIGSTSARSEIRTSAMPRPFSIRAEPGTTEPIPELYMGGPCFVGVDIAARNDLFVIWVLELVGDVLVTREVIARRRISFAEQDALLDEVMARYRVVRVRMDQTGMGEKPVEDAKRRYGDYRVEGVLFSAAAKLDMATVLKESMQDRKTRLPAGDPVLRADLHSIKSQVGITGTRRLVADGESDGHADRFWAAALACSAAEMGEQLIAYQGVPGTRSRFALRFLTELAGCRQLGKARIDALAPVERALLPP